MRRCLFNRQPSTRRNDERRVVSYGGGKRYRRSDAGVEESDLSGGLVFESLNPDHSRARTSNSHQVGDNLLNVGGSKLSNARDYNESEHLGGECPRASHRGRTLVLSGSGGARALTVNNQG